MTGFVLADMVAETTTTTGTGALTLAGAYQPAGANVGYRTVSTGVGSGNSSTFKCDDGAGNWEVFIGTLTGSSLSRDTVLSSSNSGSAVSFGAGTKLVIACAAAEELPAFDLAGKFNMPQRPSRSSEVTPASNVIGWDLTKYQVLPVNWNANVSTFNITGTLSALLGNTYSLVVRANGGSTFAMNSNMKPPGGSWPTFTSTSGKLNLLSFQVESNDGGTTFVLACTGYALGD